MNIVSIIALIIGAAGVAFGLECYRRLHEWARLCQNGRIFIAYNNKVRLEGPITEWVQWTRMLKADEASTGRVIYNANKVRVGISMREKPDTTTVKRMKTAEPEAVAS